MIIWELGDRLPKELKNKTNPNYSNLFLCVLMAFYHRILHLASLVGVLQLLVEDLDVGTFGLC